jgi:murein DD-endopeptidase MepM/ murein hydrolase activator NlpD
MAEFDPRRPTFRLAPRLLVGAFGLMAVGLGWRIATSEPILVAQSPGGVHLGLAAPTSVSAGASSPVNIPVRVQAGETLEVALGRAGVAPQEAREVAAAIGKAINIVDIKAGMVFDAAVAQPLSQRGPVRLIGLTMRTSPATTILVSRTFDGALRLRAVQDRVHDEAAVAQGVTPPDGSLYDAALRAGATPAVTAEAVKLFSHKLDFSRDLDAGDRFRLVFDRKVTDDGKTVATGDLLYAEVEAQGQVRRFYRFDAPGASTPEYFDETGKNIKEFLLRTPIDGARITSGFGLRIHPILGFTKMHTGIDFGAPVGTPVYAAGDGSVEEVRWLGGYGRWIKLKHSGGWETGYGHLSAWAVKPGQPVRQGQIIAYSGSSGESTGPHLHYEVIDRGVKINPKGARAPQGAALAGRDLIAFRAEMNHVDALLAGSPPLAGPQLARAEPPRSLAGLRPAETLDR